MGERLAGLLPAKIESVGGGGGADEIHLIMEYNKAETFGGARFCVLCVCVCVCVCTRLWSHLLRARSRKGDGVLPGTRC